MDESRVLPRLENLRGVETSEEPDECRHEARPACLMARADSSPVCRRGSTRGTGCNHASVGLPGTFPNPQTLLEASGVRCLYPFFLTP